MKSNGNIWIIGVIIIALILGGYFVFNRNKKTDDLATMEKKEVEAGHVESSEVKNLEGKMMEDGTKTSSTYETYSPEKLALANTGKVVLFFHASWCPTCKATNSDIEKNVSNIPEGIHILKTDYDTYTALKQKYGVTYQHTFVQVDAKGNLINKWSGSSSLSEILTKIK